MAGSVNKVTLIGNLARDPEFRSFDNGNEVANLRLITNESWTDKTSGERKDRSEGHTIVIFNERLIDVVRKYCKKGDRLYIEGSLKTRKWQDKDGNDKYTTEIELQKYRGELQMLGGSGGGADQGDDGDRSDNSGDRGGNRGGGNQGGGNRGGGNYGGQGGGSQSGGNQGGGRGGFDAEIDDDVPF